MFTDLRAPADVDRLGIVLALVAALTFIPAALAAQSDNTRPTVAVTAPAANATVSGAIPVSATASDNVGVAGVQFRLDGAPLGAEDVAAPYTISWNTLGAATTALVFGVTKVIVGPMTMTAGTGFAKRLSVTCAGCPGEDLASEDKIQTGAGPAAATWTFNMPAHYAAQMAAFKAAGTPAYVQGAVATSNSASPTVARAFGAPVTAGRLLVVAVAWQGNSAVSVTDNRGNTYAVATSAYDLPNGQSLAILYAANVNGGATTVTASFGGAAPTLQRLAIHEYAGMATVAPLDVTAKNSADGVTTANTITSGWATPTGIAPVANGAHTLTAQARDAAGNTTTSAAVTVTVANGGDTTPPVISGVIAASITAVGATIGWTTNEASDSQVDYGLTTAYGSSSAVNASLGTAHTVSLGGLTDGALYHYRVRSRDAAGNLALSGDLTFATLVAADTMGPTVAVTAPAANTTVSGAIPVSATASDNVGVAGVQFRLDGAPLGAEDVAAPYTISWNTLGAATTALVFGVTKVIVGPMTMTAGTGFTKRLSVTCAGCPGEDLASEDKIQTGAGPAAATWTFNMPAHYAAQMAAFKAAGTPAYVQGAVATSNSASPTVARAFGAPVTAGRLLVVAVAWQGNSAVSVTDNRGNTYAVATSAYDLPNGQSLAILYAANVNGGATTVTASFGGAAPTLQRLAIHEYAGMATVAPLDVTAKNSADGVTTANTITSGWATPTGIAPVANGAHTLTAQARDAAGNTTTSAAVTVTVANGGDTTPPVISGVTAASITAVGATIGWTTNEASDSQVDYGLTTAYGSSSAVNASLGTAHTVSLGGLTDGALYHYRVRSRDAAGNLALSGDLTFATLVAADTMGPTVAVTAPAANTTVSGAIPVSATASDNVGVAGVQFRLDGAPLGAEDVAAPYTISWNTLGAATTALVFGVTKVIVGPMTMTAGTGFTKRLSVTCAGCPGEDLASEDKIQTGAGPAAATWTFNMPAHYAAQMAAFKAAGTPAYVQGAVATSNSASPTVARAFGAPVTAGRLLVVAVAWQGNSAVSVTDNRGNTYAVATSAYDLPNGQSLAILYAANVNGGATTVTASFGGAAPTLQRLAIHEYAGMATVAPLDVTAKNSADGVTTANTITSGWATPTGIAPVANGAHTLTAQARDAAGNTTTSAAVTVTVANGGDTTPPVISGVTAASITAVGATIGWTTNEASDSQVDYGLTTAYGSSSPLNGALVTTHAVILGALTSNATYHVRARSRDAAGALALAGDFTFTTPAMDPTPPVISITAPLANATVSGMTPFSATVTDNVGVVGVEFKLDGVLLAPEDTAAPYTVAWDTTAATNASHTLTAVAWDAAGNQSTATRTVVVANAPAQVRLAWDANTEADLAGYKVYVGTSSGAYSTSYNVGNTTSYTVTGLAPGNVYYFAVGAYDHTGFESAKSNEVMAAK